MSQDSNPSAPSAPKMPTEVRALVDKHLQGMQSDDNAVGLRRSLVRVQADRAAVLLALQEVCATRTALDHQIERLQLRLKVATMQSEELRKQLEDANVPRADREETGTATGPIAASGTLRGEASESHGAAPEVALGAAEHAPKP